ncbi:MAG: hypothetical protein B6D77_18530 [gamma proteobacterium symbiont of Ctena orbiculata]|nr:MAG: hypothetical protein B6D77_18530 [gamma proteobacterium symbiont of Ctena orbiculata]PVV21654.1 MAG: hypothetical protein B6D78_07010 [gamma proteobacterium symbiont of Ctena orbiculata]PVV26490.1 MAG: hypothetical protein B6D79_06100 [gamma proteobacterium symbiont of Ctena orbiculata]
MGSRLIEPYIEAICEKGCKSVREDMRLLSQGVVLPELKDLDEIARQMVLKELRSIMAVYGDGCPVVQPQSSNKNDIKHENRKKNTSR